MENDREYYVHDAGCPETLLPPNDRGLQTCTGCAGIFDADTGEGIATTDYRLDENWPERRAAGAEWNDGGPA